MSEESAYKGIKRSECLPVTEAFKKRDAALLDKLLAKAREKAFEAPTRSKLCNPPIWIASSQVPVIAIEDLEKIIAELVNE
jgi:hypothetical protein